MELFSAAVVVAAATIRRHKLANKAVAVISSLSLVLVLSSEKCSGTVAHEQVVHERSMEQCLKYFPLIFFLPLSFLCIMSKINAVIYWDHTREFALSCSSA